MPYKQTVYRPFEFAVYGVVSLFRHLTWDDRLRIETMLNDKRRYPEIAERLCVSLKTIYNEVSRGRYERLNSDWTRETRYSPDIAESKAQANREMKGASLKIGKDHALASFLEGKIVEDRFPPRRPDGD